MTEYSRRDVIKLSGLTALALAGTAVGAAVRPPAALAAWFDGQNRIYRRSELLLGTYVTLTVIDPSHDRAESAVAAALAEMGRLSAILTRYSTDGPLAELHRVGWLASPQPELVTVIQAAADYNRLTDGAFDITVAPVLDRIKTDFDKTGRAPSRGELAGLMKLVDGSGVEASASLVSLPRQGMALTLDGLAKGYIVDRAAAVLKSRGVNQALINAGGDIVALGQKGARPWRIGIIDPSLGKGRGPVVDLAGAAMATSGNYEVYFDAEKLHHHIIDPASGQSPRNTVSATVRAASCLRADALSTSLFCLPTGQGAKLLPRLGASALVIDRRGHRVTEGYWS